jgi:hypothetical protein
MNRFTKLFTESYCKENGAIDWVKLVEFNSKNLDVEDFLP